MSIYYIFYSEIVLDISKPGRNQRMSTSLFKNIRFRAVIVGVFIVSFILVLNVRSINDSGSNGFIENIGRQFEWLGYDLRMRWGINQNKLIIDNRIVIVDIDEKSLKKEGHWPWPRRKIANLIEDLFKSQAAVVGLDIMFPEKERNPVDLITERLEHHDTLNKNEISPELKSIRNQFDGDRYLASIVSRYPVVLGFTFSNKKGESTGKLPLPISFAGLNKELLNNIEEMRIFKANIAAIQTDKIPAGFFNVVPESDGVIRKSALLYKYNGEVYPSLALELARLYLPPGDIVLSGELVGDRNSLNKITSPGMDSHIDSKADIYIPYRGRQGSYLYLSATDILKGDFDKKMVQDSIILIGTTAEGLYDLRSTPVENIYPGVEIHANVLSGLLDGVYPEKPTFVDGAYFTELVVLGLLCVLLFPFLSPVSISVLSLILIAGHIGLSLWLWQFQNLIYPFVHVALMIFLVVSWNLIYGFKSEFATRRRLVSRFGQYVPPALVDEMNKDPQGEFGLDGESRVMTVLFADIRSFTTISESLEANELKKLLNYFFTPMTRIIFNKRGTIDKYVGDMIMAFWGAPLKDENHQSNAITAALEMLKIVKEMKPELDKRGWPEINIGIGLNTGKMNVGDMGSEFRRAYTVIGDAVNLGSRLEGLTKFYGVSLIVSDTTMDGQDQFIFRKLDRVRVKGKHEAVGIYEPVCAINEGSEELEKSLNKLGMAYQYYYSQNWDEAEEVFGELHESDPNRLLYTLYINRIDKLRSEDLPSDWDGVFTHTSK